MAILASRTYDEQTETVFYKNFRKVFVTFVACLIINKQFIIRNVSNIWQTPSNSVNKSHFSALNCRDLVDYFFDIVREISNLALEDNELAILCVILLLDSCKSKVLND